MADNQNGNIQPATQTGEGFTPVKPGERIATVDVLRGFAVLGILVINIEFFALPSMVYHNPAVAGGFTGLNLLTWQFASVFFLQKMMSIFSMLFGAGLILWFNRAKTADRPLGGLYYRRMFWLLLIGLVHAYLFWYGDILVTYALCGLLLYLFRRRSARLLIILGVLVFLFGIAVQMGSGFLQNMMREQARKVEAAEAAGESITPAQRAMADAWEQTTAYFEAADEQMRETYEVYREGSFWEIARHRAPETLVMQTQALVFIIIWRVIGLMLIGMGLMKAGVFSGERRPSFYVLWAAIGIPLGLALCVYGVVDLIAHDFDFVYRFKIGNHFNNVGSLLLALGYVGAVVAIFRAGTLKWLTSRLAAAGRMALTNYLLHTLVCTTIFYGYGLGLFGRVERIGQLGIVLAIWILQLWLSPIWLHRYRFGPAEWLWRSLTYWRLQPMKIETSTGG